MLCKIVQISSLFHPEMQLSALPNQFLSARGDIMRAGFVESLFCQSSLIIS